MLWTKFLTFCLLRAPPRKGLLSVFMENLLSFLWGLDSGWPDSEVSFFQGHIYKSNFLPQCRPCFLSYNMRDIEGIVLMLASSFSGVRHLGTEFSPCYFLDRASRDHITSCSVLGFPCLQNGDEHSACLQEEWCIKQENTHQMLDHVGCVFKRTWFYCCRHHINTHKIVFLFKRTSPYLTA